MQSWNSWSLLNLTLYQSWNFCCCITKPHVDSTQFNVVDYWLFGWHWTSRLPHPLNGMDCMLGPFMMAVKCWNVQCLGLIASLGTFFFTPWWKKKFSSTVQLLTLTKKLKTSHARDTNKSTGNARLSSSTEWNYSVEKQTRLINNDSCVLESQLVGLNHYLCRCTPDIFIFP